MLPVYLAPGPLLRGLVTVDDGLEGRGRNGEPVKPLLVLRDLESLFEEDENVDAHAVAYCVYWDGEPVEKQPRLTKEVLGQLRDQGFEILCHTVWIDLDLKDIIKDKPKGKVKWTDLSDSEVGLVWGLVEEAHQRLAAKGMAWTASYTTSGGLRFVHALALPVHAGEGYEALLGRFHAAYNLAGLPVDEACRDWTRLYRAPRVLRDDARTVDQDWFSYRTDFADDTTFYVPRESDLVPPEHKAVVRTVTVDRDRPDPEEARALVEFLNPNNGQWQHTVAGKAAKAALKGAQAFDVIFNRLPIAREGKRHDMLTKVVGEVVGHLHGADWSSPELVYALLYDAAGRLGEDEDWTGKVWEMATTFWDRETARKATKAQEIAERVAEQEAVRETERERFLRGIRDWLPQVASMEDEAAIEYVKNNRYGIAMDSRRDLFHVLLPTGYYDDHVCGANALPKLIEQRGMNWLVPTEEARDDGRGNVVYVPVRTDRLVQRHARVYTSEEIRLDKKASYIQHDWQGRDVFVEVPFALRDDVRPMLIDPIYEYWLAAAGGDPARRDTILRALGYLLLFQYGPTAAVLLWGEASAGKSMTAVSLGQCITTRRVADGSALTDNFNDSLRKSPIIHIEEAADRGNKGIDAASALRRIITATSIGIEQKGRDKVMMQGGHRVLMTSNSKDIIQRMMGSQARTRADWAAVGERLAEFCIDNEATRWFERNNKGWHETRRWIGTHGRTGLYAQFWFWVIRHLIEWDGDRPRMLGRRLLFEGNMASRTVANLEANAAGIPEVACAINRLLGQAGKPSVVLQDGVIYLTSQAVLQDAIENGRIRPDLARQALESLLDPNQPEERFSVGGAQGRWKILDAKRIYDIIEQHTIPNKAFAAYLK